jgi:hypothetical protein
LGRANAEIIERESELADAADRDGRDGIALDSGCARLERHRVNGDRRGVCRGRDLEGGRNEERARPDVAIDVQHRGARPRDVERDAVDVFGDRQVALDDDVEGTARGRRRRRLRTGRDEQRAQAQCPVTSAAACHPRESTTRPEQHSHEAMLVVRASLRFNQKAPA